MRSIYESLPRWRRPLLIALALTTFAALAMMPRLRAVFEPEELVPPAPAEAARASEMLGPFGESDEPLLVLIEARDVLSLEALRYQHAIARHIEREPWVRRVDGVTITALPHFEMERERSATLEDLDETASDPEIEDALGRVLASDPDRFPMGLLSLSERKGGRVFAMSPLVEGEIGARERAAIEDLATRSSAIRGRLISEDRRFALLVVEPRDGLEEIAELRAWLRAQRAPQGARAELAGMPEVRASMVETLHKDQLQLVVLAIFGSLLVLAFGMRSWSGVLLPLASAGMTSALVVGAMAVFDEPINLLNNTIAPLLITIGLGDAVHVIARYREELRRNPERFAAARRTMRAMAGPCFLTAVTTAIGFGSLVVSETSIVRHYAVTASLGVLLGYLITVTFVPAALPSFAMPASKERRATLERVATAIARFSARHAAMVLAVALFVLGVTAWIGKDVRVDSTLSAQLDERSEVRRTFERIETHLSGVRAIEIGLHARTLDRADVLSKMQRFERWLRAQPNVLHVDGPAERLAEIWTEISGNHGQNAFRDPGRAAALVDLVERAAPDLFARTMRDGRTRARIEVRMRDAGERQAALLIARIERRLSRWDGVDFAVGGEAARSARGLDRLSNDLTGSAGLAMAIIFFLIGALLRSVRLGIASILPNVLPLSITLAYMVLRDIPLHAATTIVFSISIGLAVDDTIHILSRYREEIAEGRGRIAAMLRSLRSSGRAALVSAGAIWVGYATLGIFASFVPIRLFGELSLVALGSALVCEILVLPATLALIGPVRDQNAPATRACAPPSVGPTET